MKEKIINSRYLIHTFTWSTFRLCPSLFIIYPAIIKWKYKVKREKKVMLQVLNIYCWVEWISTKFIKINEAIIVLIKESKSLLQSPKKYDYLIFIEIFKYLRFIIDIWHNFLHQFEELQISWNFHYLFRWWGWKIMKLISQLLQMQCKQII